MPRTDTAPDPAERPAVAAVRRLPEQGRSRVRVEQILDAAAALIAADGVDAMTMSDLAAAAEVSLPSIYRYFPGKQSIVRTLAERYSRQVRDQLTAVLRLPQDRAQARQDLTAAMRSYWNAYRSDPALRAVWSAAMADPDLAQLDVDDSRVNGALIAATLADVADGDRPLETSAFLASHLAGAAVRLAVMLGPEEADDIIAAMTDHVLPALLGLADPPAP